MFCDTIVLRHVSSGNFMLNAMLQKPVLNVLSHVLAPSIGAEGLHFIACLQFGPSDKHFEMLPSLRFSSKGRDGSKMGSIINEGNEVSVPLMGGNREWAAYVSVHIAKYIIVVR